MAENTLKLTDKGTEYPARFGGHEVTYTTVAAVPGDVDATLAAIRERIAPEADTAEVLADYFNGYGLTYAVNGLIKRFLASDEAAQLTVEDALAEATRRANAFRVGTVRKSDGSGKGGKVKRLEAERDTLKAQTLDMYRALNKSLRRQFRPQLLTGGSVTAEELDAIDAEE